MKQRERVRERKWVRSWSSGCGRRLIIVRLLVQIPRRSFPYCLEGFFDCAELFYVLCVSTYNVFL